jgi:hypothetical protein
MTRPARLELNAPGQFYTTGECLACALPEAEAPECLAPLDDDNYHTYFRRQPTTEQEIEHACAAALVCCVAAIRYGGNDPAIIQRLGNREKYCDNPLPGGPVRFSWETDEQWAKVTKQGRPWWQFWRT